MNGASVVFFLILLHVGRLYYNRVSIGSKIYVFAVGWALYLLFVISGFTGYVLVWGQMSLWATTVIASLVTVLPIIGTSLLTLILGGSVIVADTYLRFQTFHFLLPLFFFPLVLAHILCLHGDIGSSYSETVSSHTNQLYFYPIHYWRDIIVWVIAILSLVIIGFLYTSIFDHHDNHNYADPLVTPHHIVPEWYLLLWYGVLRSVPLMWAGCWCILEVVEILMVSNVTTSINTNKFTTILRGVDENYVLVGFSQMYLLSLVFGCLILVSMFAAGDTVSVVLHTSFLLLSTLMVFC